MREGGGAAPPPLEKTLAEDVNERERLKVFFLYKEDKGLRYNAPDSRRGDATMGCVGSSAYLMADWVATVALGKISDAKVDNDNDNALRAIWAPLLLLHLGGPDTITAYSLEDNQLWVRHLLGLVVQLSVSIYVILMSWQRSWFSFLSFLALVAGIIKYGERTWVLKSVSSDKTGHIVPFLYLKPKDHGDNYVRVVTSARYHLMVFKGFMEYYDWKSYATQTGGIFADKNFFWNVLEVVFMREEEKWHKVDVAITEVLLVGALMLEIYSVIALHLSSDWAMLWLITCSKCEAVIKLRSKIPWLFKKKKNWSNRIGQFDILSFCLKNVQADQKFSRRILGGLLEIINCKDEFNRYVHRTFVDDCSHLYSVITDYCQVLASSTLGLDVDKTSVFNEERKLLNILGPDYRSNTPSGIIYIHILTEIFYYYDWPVVASESPRFYEENRKTTRTLSHYMMYLLVVHPSLLSISKFVSDEHLSMIYTKYRINKVDTRDVREVCQHIFTSEHYNSLPQGIEYLKGKPKAERWKILKFVWLRMLCYAAIKCQKDIHLQQLRQGGELLTLLWFFLPQCVRTLGDVSYDFDSSFALNEGSHAEKNRDTPCSLDSCFALDEGASHAEKNRDTPCSLDV
ncbi:hypothetical protein Vadar_034247 [Vaccinium darrowii]|uniref:Uncharacterized protein n=1 Tax=Vaccinium darrowii TaxID=229202 RepID=A0ACB7Z8L0_9ERIC|nr:hypothetical protein Vadar_034247 [Vaccinium darrowii]